MVKLNLVAPALRGMTLLAARTQFCAVHVTRTVTTHAVVGQFLLCYLRRVTGVAIELVVLADERPVPIAAMLKIRRLPGFVAVALATVLAESTGVGILALVATEAGFGHFVVQVAAAVTLLAVQVRVAAQQRKTGFLRVVEFLRLPARGRVAIGAFCPALAPMNIVGRMTGDTLLRSSFVPVAKVTTGAGDVGVFVQQRIVSFRVIKVDLTPARRAVTGGAVPAQLALVGLLLLMTIEAGSARLTIGLTGRMTVSTVERGMAAGQGKFGQLMIELRDAQFDDVACASQVF